MPLRVPLPKSLVSVTWPPNKMAKFPSPDFSQWKMNHTMIRVKDPQRSLAFYQKLGFSLIDKLSQPDAKFDLYFLAFNGKDMSSPGSIMRSDRQGLLELTHNYGTENDDAYVVSNGNVEPYLGLQHLGITVHNLELLLLRLANDSIEAHKCHTVKNDLREGDDISQSVICKDPDGYYVELISNGRSSANTDIPRNLFNFTGLRIKDPRLSLSWYSQVLGMKLLHQSQGKGFSTFWLGYFGEASLTRRLEDREGVLQLLWLHSSEKREGNVYHNGNNQPQGFGHLGEIHL